MSTREELMAEIEALRSQLRSQEEKINSLEKLNSWYIEQLKLRAKEKFGASSEKADADQISLFDLFNEAETLREPVSVEPELETVIKEHRRKRSKRGNKFDDLPIEVIEYKLEDNDLTCDKCGSLLTVMKKEIRKELVIIPAEAKIIEHVTYSYSCRNCDKNGTEGYIKEAAHPKSLIPKSFVSASSLAYILNQKYTMAMPLYRQEQEFKRLGFEISRQNLSNWVIKGAAILEPLYLELKEHMLQEDLLHADETTLEVLHEPGRNTTSKSYVWVYRTSAYTSTPVIIYEYTVGRSGDFAKEFLKDWKGKYLHCDGYSGYKKLEGITLCGCLVHAKRKFHEALAANPNSEYAKAGEQYIQKLFAVEDHATEKGMSIDERLALRKERSKIIFEEFYRWISEIEPKTLPQSLVGKAITYAINQKEYLGSFLIDGRIQLSNNLCEQMVKPFVIGRRNWLFSNTPNGAKSSTIIYSIIQTAIANNLRPAKYLEYIFTRVQAGDEIQTYTPWSDQIPEYCKNKSTQQCN